MPQETRTSDYSAGQASATHSTVAIIWCQQCQSDEHIVIEGARRRKRNGGGIWDVDYCCTHCDSFYRHEIQLETLSKAMAHAMISVIQQP